MVVAITCYLFWAISSSLYDKYSGNWKMFSRFLDGVDFVNGEFIVVYITYKMVYTVQSYVCPMVVKQQFWCFFLVYLVAKNKPLFSVAHLNISFKQNLRLYFFMGCPLSCDASQSKIAFLEINSLQYDWWNWAEMLYVNGVLFRSPTTLFLNGHL